MRLELRICSKDEYSIDKVTQTLTKAEAKVFEYVQSDDYEEPPNDMQKAAAGGKGLWHFSQDILLQYLFYTAGLYFHLRRKELAFKKETCIRRAQRNYLRSF